LKFLAPSTVEEAIAGAAVLGGLAWGLTAWLILRWKAGGGKEPTSGWKFLLANLACLVIGLGGYALEVWLSPTIEKSREGAGLAVAMTFMGSQTLHWTSGGVTHLAQKAKTFLKNKGAKVQETSDIQESLDDIQVLLTRLGKQVGTHGLALEKQQAQLDGIMAGQLAGLTTAQPEQPAPSDEQ
jgi:hypothetical protein